LFENLGDDVVRAFSRPQVDSYARQPLQFARKTVRHSGDDYVAKQATSLRNDVAKATDDVFDGVDDMFSQKNPLDDIDDVDDLFPQKNPFDDIDDFWNQRQQDTINDTLDGMINPFDPFNNGFGY
jgi:hypothetical protein